MKHFLGIVVHPKAKRSYALLWLALVGTFAVTIVMSYSSEVRFTTIPGNLYGVRLVNGQFQVFRGTRRGGLNEQVRGTWMPWDGKDLTNQPSFHESDILERTQHIEAWPPFWNTERIGTTWTRRSYDGVITFQDFGRELETRAASGWLVLAILSAPLWFAWMAAERHKRVPGCCIKCGYDLRATPERCPECGGIAMQAAARGSVP